MNPFLPGQGPEFHRPIARLARKQHGWRWRGTARERLEAFLHDHQVLDTLIALVVMGGFGALLWWGLFS